MKKILLIISVVTSCGTAFGSVFSHEELSSSVEKRDIKLVKKILDANVDPNEKIPETEMDMGYGCSDSWSNYDPPLHILAKNSLLSELDKEIIDILFEKGATIKGNRDAYGNTALHIAAQYKNVNFLRYIKKKIPGNELKLLNNFRKTPEDVAREKGNMDFVDFLKYDSQTEIDQARRDAETKLKADEERWKKEWAGLDDYCAQF